MCYNCPLSSGCTPVNTTLNVNQVIVIAVNIATSTCPRGVGCHYYHPTPGTTEAQNPMLIIRDGRSCVYNVLPRACIDAHAVGW